VACLDLAYDEIEKGEVIANFYDGFGSRSVHTCSKAAVQLYGHYLAEYSFYLASRNIRERDIIDDVISVRW
jgi:tRNA G37 N-methylase Trm5